MSSTQSTAQLEGQIDQIETRLKVAERRQGGRSLDDIQHDLNKASKAHKNGKSVSQNLKETVEHVVLGAFVRFYWLGVRGKLILRLGVVC